MPAMPMPAMSSEDMITPLRDSRIHSRVDLLDRGHRLPQHVLWKITLITAVGMAVLNCLTVCAMRNLVGIKFNMMQRFTDSFGVTYGVVAFVACATCTATACTILIAKVSPEAGSSGAPENKGWLNGSSPYPAGGYTKDHLWVRACATVLGNASGYPVGREGPTVSMGSNFAFLVTEYYAAPYVKKWVQVASTTPALIIDHERMMHAKRVACAVGGACGMAMIFDSPLGGIMYMFEEVSSMCWPLELTFRAFVGTIICALLSRFLLNLAGTDIKKFVIYEWSPQRYAWDWWDVPWFVVLAAFLGVFSAFHTRLCLQVGNLRADGMKTMEKLKIPYCKNVDAVLYAMLCALVTALVSQMGRCQDMPSGDKVEFVKYNCPPGQYNSVASLLLTTSEAAVNLLFSRENVGAIHPLDGMLAFLAYTAINIGLTGVPVPSGNFTGTMLIGGLLGRMTGALAEKANFAGAAVSGVYAMVGSAAMLCGFKRMSMAVVIFVSTAANDFNLVPPLMLSVVVSLLLSKTMLARGYDEEQLLRRKVAFLEPELPHSMNMMEAGHLCDDMPDEFKLHPESGREKVHRAMKAADDRAHKGLPAITEFPVVTQDADGRGGQCVGFASRDRLEAAWKACAEDEEKHKSVETPDMFDRHISEDMIQKLGNLSTSAVIPVQKLVDPFPYTILEDLPAPRAYALFAKAGISTACVVSRNGRYRGVISRASLIHATRKAED